MITARTKAELQAALAALARPRALIPTMGALHAGHLALIAAARSRANSTVASIFVNPLQFAANEDLARYPRDEAGDTHALETAGCDVLWMPPVDLMFPRGACTIIEVGNPAEGFEGAARPGHFRGVATVVAKLLHQTGPDLVFFGEKDWQQVQVIRRMVTDLDWPVEVVAIPTVREPDGLALSSRNRFLTPAERQIAPQFHRILHQVVENRRHPNALVQGRTALVAAGFHPEYLAIVDPSSMRPLPEPAPPGPARLIAVVRLGTVRLLDNIPFAAR